MHAGGATVDRCDYDAFGAGYAGDAPCLSGAAFAGQARDGETGLYHLRARQYDPGTGCFTQADPVGYTGGGNRYAYAGNNPHTCDGTPVETPAGRVRTGSCLQACP